MKLTRQLRNSLKLGKRIPPALLAKLDDTAVELTIDGMKLEQVCFPGRARKSSFKYHLHRGADKEALTRILKSKSPSKKMNPPFNSNEILRKIFQMPCLKGLRVSKDRPNSPSEWFKKQLQSYIRIYDPNCGFKIGVSRCLSGKEPEAAVFAKSKFKKGETIKFLSGVCLPLRKDEMAQLESSDKDFSILQSSRYQSPAMFLGPARFVNHDCKANSTIVWPDRCSANAYIEAVNDIDKGDEITVFYGKHYFGHNNEKCLCLSCSTRRVEP